MNNWNIAMYSLTYLKEQEALKKQAEKLITPQRQNQNRAMPKHNSATASQFNERCVQTHTISATFKTPNTQIVASYSQLPPPYHINKEQKVMLCLTRHPSVQIVVPKSKYIIPMQVLKQYYKFARPQDIYPSTPNK